MKGKKNDTQHSQESNYLSGHIYYLFSINLLFQFCSRIEQSYACFFFVNILVRTDLCQHRLECVHRSVKILILPCIQKKILKAILIFSPLKHQYRAHYLWQLNVSRTWRYYVNYLSVKPNNDCSEVKFNRSEQPISTFFGTNSMENILYLIPALKNLEKSKLQNKNLLWFR